MYSSKRFSYTPPVYRARNLLAALDYNQNVDREPIRNKDGTLRYRSCTFVFNTLAYSCLIQGSKVKNESRRVYFFSIDLVTKHYSVDINIFPETLIACDRKIKQ